MQSDLAQNGANDVGGNQADQQDGDEVPEQDQAGSGDGGVQDHLRGDQGLPLLDAPRAPNIFVFLEVPVRRLETKSLHLAPNQETKVLQFESNCRVDCSWCAATSLISSFLFLCSLHNQYNT